MATLSPVRRIDLETNQDDTAGMDNIELGSQVRATVRGQSCEAVVTAIRDPLDYHFPIIVTTKILGVDIECVRSELELITEEEA
jgi:hypothetical protein